MSKTEQYLLNKISKIQDKKCEIWDILKDKYNMKRTEKGFQNFNNSIFKDVLKLQTQSKETDIYVSNEKQFILKIPRYTDSYTDIYRSYIIGVSLDCLDIPVFPECYCIMLYKDIPIICEEYIEGYTMDDFLNFDITFSDFLNVFVQILLCLQYAQEKISFCHYDLHLKNIIIQVLDIPYEYTLVLNGKTYSVRAERFLPVLIDYGTSSIKIDNISIGSVKFFKYGIFNFLTKGSDMYKLLFNCYLQSPKNLKKQIGSLFLFYGNNDPYKILECTQSQLYYISKTFLKKISGTKASYFSPQDFIDWISNCKSLREQINCFKVLN